MGDRRSAVQCLCLEPHDRRGKTIAPSRHRLNATALRSSPVENAAERRYLESQVALLDGHLGPDSGHDFRLRTDLVVMLNQHAQQVESATANRYRGQNPALIPTKQPAPVEVKPLEQENFALSERVHASVSPRHKNLACKEADSGQLSNIF